MRPLYLAGMLYLGVTVYALARGPLPVDRGGPEGFFTGSGSNAATWFSQVKPYCNVLEVATVHRRVPPPRSLEGVGYSAACWSLAGRLDAARDLIVSLPEDERWKAAGIVFEVGHPVADMGDDRSAGPIMELVVEFWPNHYMALYHAGAARYALGDWKAAERHLRSFLVYYEVDDGWTRNAQHMLDRIASR